MPGLTITAPGIYPITSDLTQSNPADHGIRIAPGVHYVTILLYGRLVGAGGSGSCNSGIHADGNAAVNIIGMGGTIRGFGYGVRMVGCNIPRVQNVFVQDAWFRGIRIDGEDPIVCDNDVRNVTGGTWTPDAYCMGIEVQGVLIPEGKPKVLRNFVQNVAGMGSGESVGIAISDKGIGGVVKDNVVINPDMRPGSFGLWIGGNSDVAVVHNHFDTWGNGMAFSSPPTGEVDENSFKNCIRTIVDSGGDVMIGPGDQPDL